MAGSLRKVRDNAWELRVYLGRDSSGRVHHLHRTFQGNKRAAELELARLITEQESKPTPVPEQADSMSIAWGPHTTINDAVYAWQANGWADLSPKTVRGYEEIWNRYIKETIGMKKIAGLNSYVVETYLRSLKDAGAGRDTVRRVRNVLHRTCRLASRWSGGTLPNPVANTELPVWPLSERPKPVRAPTVEEIRSVIETATAHDERFGAFVRLLAATGVRRGEACALRWSDIEWKEMTIQIRQAVVAARGGAVVKDPKTRASIRTVALDPGTLGVLRELQKSQRRLAKVCTMHLSSDGFVFSSSPGGIEPPHPDSMTDAFATVRIKAKVSSDVHLHSLRHFHSTVLDPVISERQKQARMGWSTVQMARHYTDAILDEDRKAARHVGQLLEADA